MNEPTSPNNFFAAWQSGALTHQQALNGLCAELSRVNADLAPLKAREQELRDQISRVVEQLGGRADVGGFGRLMITAPTIVHGYDREQLDGLIYELEETNPELAERLEACRTQRTISGSLRIVREKLERNP